MDLTGKRALVVGMARSGLAATRFLMNKGALVTITDQKQRAEAGAVAEELEQLGVNLALGEYPLVSQDVFDMVIPSPGVPMDTPLLLQARHAQIPIVGELELAFWFAQAPMVAITGTNGKTTTTTLVGEIFKVANKKTFVAGNIGIPLVSAIEDYFVDDMVVAEVSSFQLESTHRFRPKVAVLLNITPDHLDRHKTMAGYIAAKARIFANQQAEDYAVLNYDDTLVRDIAEGIKSRVIFFSRKHMLDEGVFVRDGHVIIANNGEYIPVIRIEDIGIIGSHNLENALAATAAAHVMGVEIEVITRTLKQFGGVAHRLEFVRELKGVRFINDSKGTNPDATIKALEAFQQPIVLIAGGMNKGSDFAPVVQLIKEKVKTLVLIGEAAPDIENAVRAAGFSRILNGESLETAVELAASQAGDGDVVLLSPACASWDMFKDYEERGNLFKLAVNNLRG